MNHQRRTKRCSPPHSLHWRRCHHQYNIDSQLISVQRFGCRGLSSLAQVNAWLSYSSIFSIICAMHSLDTTGAAKLKTHFGCGIQLFLPFLGGIDCQLLSKDVLEERKGANSGENTILYSISRSCENLCFRILRAQRCLCCQARLHQSTKNSLNKE
jgi:hypothetical protein